LFLEKKFLVAKINYEALKGPPIDQKFLRKYGSKQEISSRPSLIIPFKASTTEIEIKKDKNKISYRKINQGKKKEKPWKKYQKS